MQATKDTARTISLRASPAYIEAINHIAKQKGMKTADLTREILDEHLKVDLADTLPFFEKRGRKSDQMDEKSHDTN